MVDLIANFDPSWTGHPTTRTRDSIATEDDALLATLHLAQIFEELRERGAVDDELSYRLCAPLAVVRDYILPLPEQRLLDAEPEKDRTPAFLQEAIDLVRRSRG